VEKHSYIRRCIGVAQLKSVKESNNLSYVISTEGLHGRPATQKKFLEMLRNKFSSESLNFGEGEKANFIFMYEVKNFSTEKIKEIVNNEKLALLNKIREIGSSENAEIAFGGEVKKD
jgi:hypothetical protein